MPQARRPDLCAAPLWPHRQDLPVGPARIPDRLHRLEQRARRPAPGRFPDDADHHRRGGVKTMLIRVEHATCYAYSEPLVSSTQYLRMTPLSGPTQAVESWKLSCPGAATTPWQDQYGNLCHTLTVAQPVESLEIKVCGLVRTRETNGVVGTAPAELPPAIYLRETPYTVVSPSIGDFAARFAPKLKRDAIEALHEIMMAVADAV